MDRVYVRQGKENSKIYIKKISNLKYNCVKFLIKIFDWVCRIVFYKSSAMSIGKGTVVSWFKMRAASHGRLVIGENSVIRCRVSFDHHDGEVCIGDRTYIGDSNLVCHSKIVIGNDVIISWDVTIVDHDSHSLNWRERKDDVIDWNRNQKNWDHIKKAPVHIEDKVWLGFGVSVLKGVTIGTGAVVAAQAVVTKDVPPYTLVGGNPAKVIRLLNNETFI